MADTRRFRNLRLTLRYEDDLHLFRSRSSRAGIAVVVFLGLWLPLTLRSDFSLGILIDAGILAIGAIGLNVLTGYTGQVSLGHAFFIGVGSYAAVWFGGHEHMALPVWLLAAAVIGGVIGAIIGPFALRLRGNYLAVVSLGLVFLGLHVFHNWHQVTGGPGGTSVTAPLKVGPLNFGGLKIGHTVYTRNQSFLLLVVLVLALVALLAKNMVRSRPGRAMQAVRDRDVAAEVIGVSLSRYKIGAFVVSSAMAAMAGALFGVHQQFVQPDSWNLNLSIEYIAVIIIGGIGTIYGSMIGALFIAFIPQLIDRYSRDIPLVAKSASTSGFQLTVFELNQIIFGALIVGFLMFEPLGLAAVWRRARSYVHTWPFSY
jgi:branched-chain amino acid transport system permease protein